MTTRSTYDFHARKLRGGGGIEAEIVHRPGELGQMRRMFVASAAGMTPAPSRPAR